jgi:hypothetical protein
MTLGGSATLAVRDDFSFDFNVLHRSTKPGIRLAHVYTT